MEECNAELTKESFVMATQNEDLAILKLLVEHTKPKRNQGQDIELSQLNQSDLKEWLFGKDNIFLPKIMAKENDLSKYLKKVYKKEFGEEYKTSNHDTSAFGNQTSDALEDAKALFELQSQQGDLDSNMNLNTSLNLSRNIELLILNNKKHFDNFITMRKPLLNLTKHDPETIKKYLPLIQSESSYFQCEMFQSSVNNSNMTLVSYLLEQFPSLAQDKNLFKDCGPSKILIALKT